MFFGTGTVACHSRLPRLSEQGRHEEVVARAGQARILPRGKAARAWARSLVALGRADEARAVLLRDFRKHAELPSLVALADLEATEGLTGLAAAHYARAASLETDPLAGRQDVLRAVPPPGGAVPGRRRGAGGRPRPPAGGDDLSQGQVERR
ncbi:hypothetical protein [Nannocystis pusilla]|uniref:hypothetical protein n=1 Tax=Nannocystis pusilla TaxID=889268 RepID=UPI003DA37DEF